MRAMARTVSRAVKRSTLAGFDAHGRRLPKPKDGGRALQRSGVFVRSIKMLKSKRARAVKSPHTGKIAIPKYHVFADGVRDKKNLAKLRRLAREKTKQARAAAVLGEAFGALATGRGVSSDFTRSKRGAGIKLGKIRFRVVNKNSQIAAILSVKPKDKRAKNGNRGIYRVFEASDRYRVKARDAAAKVERHRLTSKRSIKVGK